MATKNVFRGEPRFGTPGQKATVHIGKGGMNQPGMPMGSKAGSSKNAQCSPQCGADGQRLAGGKGKGPSGYPPGYTSR